MINTLKDFKLKLSKDNNAINIFRDFCDSPECLGFKKVALKRGKPINYFISSCGNFIVVDKFSIDKLLKYNAVSEKTDTELLFNYFIIDSKSLKYKND
jgi:hypothetical protein